MTSHGKFLPPLQAYIQTSKKACDAHLAVLESDIPLSKTQSKIHLHYVKFNNNNEPRFEDLARVLVRHIVRYVLSTRTRTAITQQIDDQFEGDLFIKARDYFRKIRDSGEVGELLLFFLLESIFEAPQMVCKMELKTNPRDEVKGGDGLHMKWNINEDCLNIYLGESKLFDNISGALDKAFASVAGMNTQVRRDDELGLVTSHFKYADDTLKSEILRFLSGNDSDRKYKIIFTVLIGFDWPKYKDMLADPVEFQKNFEANYKGYLSNITGLLNKRFSAQGLQSVAMEFLFIPFKSVGDFRNCFYRHLTGEV